MCTYWWLGACLWICTIFWVWVHTNFPLLSINPVDFWIDLRSIFPTLNHYIWSNHFYDTIVGCDFKDTRVRSRPLASDVIELFFLLFCIVNHLVYHGSGCPIIDCIIVASFQWQSSALTRTKLSSSEPFSSKGGFCCLLSYWKCKSFL